MAEVFGNFVEAASQDDESLTLEFSQSARSLEQRWPGSRLSADFLAEFVGTFFEADGACAAGGRAALKDSVSFAANELMENALKYADRPSREGHRICVQPHGGGVRLYLSNRVDTAAAGRYRTTIGRLMSEESAELYEELVTRNAESNAPERSGLGLLSILLSHDASLAWKFDDAGDDGVLVTTLVSLRA